ncbi:GNAT family N-acetyltransferase, partial [bacterium]|nr:GNAT family N-acetyltransferase [bacterium]
VLYEPEFREEWQELVRESPEAWLFHTRDFIDMANPIFEMEEYSLLAFKEARLVAVLPLNYSRRERPPKMGSLAFGSAGPALRADLGEQERENIVSALVARALRLAVETGCKALRVDLPPSASARMEDLSGVSPLDLHGFQNVSTSTYILDLGPDLDAVFAGFRSTVRNIIRRSQKSDIVVRRADREGDMEAYYRLHRETYDRTGATPHPREYFEGMFSLLAPKGLADIYVAEREGRALAFVNIARYKGTAYFWTGCSNEEGRRDGANHLLQWRVIEDLKQAELRWYEIGEAFPGHSDDKLAGLDLFKRGFGGERRPFHKGRIDVSRGASSRPRLALYYLKQAVRALSGAS